MLVVCVCVCVCVCLSMCACFCVCVCLFVSMGTWDILVEWFLASLSSWLCIWCVCAGLFFSVSMCLCVCVCVHVYACITSMSHRRHKQHVPVLVTGAGSHPGVLSGQVHQQGQVRTHGLASPALHGPQLSLRGPTRHTQQTLIHTSHQGQAQTHGLASPALHGPQLSLRGPTGHTHSRQWFTLHTKARYEWMD